MTAMPSRDRQRATGFLHPLPIAPGTAAFWSLVVFAGLLMLASGPAAAADRPRVGTLGIVFENDLFYNTDRHYTNGVRVSWLSGPATTPVWALRLARRSPLFSRADTFRTNFAVGQNMYTPRDIRVDDPPADARPYAGWTYGTVGLIGATGRRFDLFELTLGMIGPASLAEHTQIFMHKITDSDEPRGWGTQLKNEPGAVLSYQSAWRGAASRTLRSRLGFELSPHLGGALGNVHTYANVGVMLRFGMHLPIDYGPPKIQPNLPGSEFFVPSGVFGWYLFAGVEGRAVARNIFLDGNTFSDSRSVKKKPLVGDLQFGVAVTWRRVRLAYIHVLRSEEFEGQEGHDDFGSISLSASF
jgi:lipid A 3-O-deacylase